MRNFAVVIVGIVMGSVVLGAQTPDPAKVAAGKKVYDAQKCGTCHKTTKDDAAGGKLSTVLADTVGKLSEADIKSWLTDTAKMEAALPKKPAVPMSAFMKTHKLSDADVTALVAYMRSLK